MPPLDPLRRQHQQLGARRTPLLGLRADPQDLVLRQALQACSDRAHEGEDGAIGKEGQIKKAPDIPAPKLPRVGVGRSGVCLDPGLHIEDADADARQQDSDPQKFRFHATGVIISWLRPSAKAKPTVHLFSDVGLSFSFGSRSEHGLVLTAFAVVRAVGLDEGVELPDVGTDADVRGEAGTHHVMQRLRRALGLRDLISVEERLCGFDPGSGLGETQFAFLVLAEEHAENEGGGHDDEGDGGFFHGRDWVKGCYVAVRGIP